MTRRGLGTGRALLVGTLAVGILDGLDAVLFFGITRGVEPIRIFQSIAAGLLGRSAFSGGWPAAVLGLGLHFFISFAVVLVFLVISRRAGWLRRHAVVSGLIYGVVVYLVMNRVVIPLSAAAGPGAWPPLPVLANGILIHMFGVGLPASLAASAAGPPTDATSSP